MGDLLEKLGLDWYVLLFHLINLIIIILAGWLLLRKPMSKMMKNQNGQLTDIVDENKRLKSEAEKVRQESEDLIADAKKEAMRITQSASKKAATNADEIIERAQVKAKGIVETARKEAAGEHERQKEDFRNKVTDLSLEIAEKILLREVNEKDNKRIIDECIKELS